MNEASLWRAINKIPALQLHKRLTICGLLPFESYRDLTVRLRERDVEWEVVPPAFGVVGAP